MPEKIVHDEDSFLGIMFALIVDHKDTEANCRRLPDFLKNNPSAGYRKVIKEVNVILSGKGPTEMKCVNRSYFEALEVKAAEMAKKYDCPFVDNEMPYGRVPQGHPVIVDYFYHEEIRGTENTGKRNC